MKYLFQFGKQKRDETRIEKWRCQDVNVVNTRTFLSIEILDDADTAYRLFKIRTKLYFENEQLEWILLSVCLVKYTTIDKKITE